MRVGQDYHVVSTRWCLWTTGNRLYDARGADLSSPAVLYVRRGYLLGYKAAFVPGVTCLLDGTSAPDGCPLATSRTISPVLSLRVVE